jgi:ABC-2 type transport system ATP-binding protein
MLQRLGIAQALIGRPQVLLLDEPCSALDPAGRYEVISILERLRGDTTVLYSTHILQDVERVADHVAIVANGRRLLQAPMRDLLTTTEILKLEVDGDPTTLVSDLRHQPYVTRVSCSANPNLSISHIDIEASDINAARRTIPSVVVRHEVVFIGLRAEHRTLEDVFLSLTGVADHHA